MIVNYGMTTNSGANSKSCHVGLAFHSESAFQSNRYNIGSILAAQPGSLVAPAVEILFVGPT